MIPIVFLLFLSTVNAIVEPYRDFDIEEPFDTAFNDTVESNKLDDFVVNIRTSSGLGSGKTTHECSGVLAKHKGKKIIITMAQCFVSKDTERSSIRSRSDDKKIYYSWFGEVEIRYGMQRNYEATQRVLLTADHDNGAVKYNFKYDLAIAQGGHDIAIIQLTEKCAAIMQAADKTLFDIKYMDLNNENQTDKGQLGPADCIVLGWGADQHKFDRKGRLHVYQGAQRCIGHGSFKVDGYYNSPNCLNKHTGTNWTIENSVMCGKLDRLDLVKNKKPFTFAAHGDEGGPVFCKNETDTGNEYKLAGILISYSYTTNNTKDTKEVSASKYIAIPIVTVSKFLESIPENPEEVEEVCEIGKAESPQMNPQLRRTKEYEPLHTTPNIHKG